MKGQSKLALGVLSVIACGLIAPAVSARTAERTVYVLTSNQQIALFAEPRPTVLAAALPVVGLAANETLQGIDIRPLNGELYGLAVNPVANTLQLYHLTMQATQVQATPLASVAGSFVDAGGGVVMLPSSSYDIDFNPQVDRVRVVAGSLNFRMNPVTGALVDGDFGGAAGSVPGVNPDGSINGGTTAVQGAAYTNNRALTTITTLYTLDSAGNQMFIQSPPNTGTQNGALTVTLGGMTVDFNANVGFDIPQGINAPGANQAATGQAYAALTVGGNSGLYRIELSTGVATLVTPFNGLSVIDLTVSTAPMGLALSSTGTQLARFEVSVPGTALTSTVTSLTAGEKLVGIDGRPATGNAYGLGLNFTSNTGTLYLLDATSGAATPIGTPGQIAFVTAGSAPVDFADTGYGVDFNPMVDRVRVVSDSGGLNFRVNPITGAPVDGDSLTAGINTDIAIQGSGTTGVSGAAYTNSVTGTLVTTLYTLDPTLNQLLIQNPPNNGTQTMSLPITLNGAPYNFTGVGGFDITPNVGSAIANFPATGIGYAVFAGGVPTGLFRVDLATGNIDFAGALALSADGLIVWQQEQEPMFADDFE